MKIYKQLINSMCLGLNKLNDFLLKIWNWIKEKVQYMLNNSNYTAKASIVAFLLGCLFGLPAIFIVVGYWFGAYMTIYLMEKGDY